MKTQPSTTLGICSGARQIGLSIFRGPELIFSAVKTIRNNDDSETLSKMRRIVGDLIHDHNISHVALQKIVFVQQHRTFVKTVFDEIRELLKELGVPFSEHNPGALRQTICQDESPTKANTSRLLAERYPELERSFKAPNVWQKRYYSLLLGAVAAGLVCATERFVEDDCLDEA